MLLLIDALLTAIIAPADPSSVFEVLTTPGALAAAIIGLAGLCYWAFNYLLEKIMEMRKDVESFKRYNRNIRESDNDTIRERVTDVEKQVLVLATKQDLQEMREEHREQFDKLLMHVRSSQWPEGAKSRGQHGDR
ncbi:MAG: hypothetical protein FKY71_20210 [Spiribacter salinus]|uniref:Uncharacterized protein n=1 Tax=Spiribacter salinus TaxID=1335746 RepID=A0A540V3J8_9GAMM|nr:MAG: hypothetical protein FKY71_20210 [Spiribacter salinus]